MQIAHLYLVTHVRLKLTDSHTPSHVTDQHAHMVADVESRLVTVTPRNGEAPFWVPFERIQQAVPKVDVTPKGKRR